MKFKLDLPINDFPVLNYKTPVLSLGSCFADEIATKLKHANFDVVANPFGTLYNPVSIAQNIDGNLHSNFIVEAGGMFHSLQHHGDLSADTVQELVANIDAASHLLHERLNRPKTTILITFGTANVFTYDDKVVANCHKLPASSFQSRLLSIDEVVSAWMAVLKEHTQHDFVFTVSPVRYTRDGLHSNNLSKSVLHLAIHELVSNCNHASYFPSYEIVVDELRDYRFYDTDLVHPNSIAVEYVWDKVQRHLFNDKTTRMYKALTQVRQMQQHRLLHPTSKEANKFIQKREEVIAQFIQEYGPLLTDA